MDEDERPSGAGVAMAVSIGVGAAFGVAVDNVPGGVAAGVVIGAALVALDRWRR